MEKVLQRDFIRASALKVDSWSMTAFVYKKEELIYVKTWLTITVKENTALGKLTKESAPGRRL